MSIKHLAQKGKSSEMFQRVHRHALAKRRCVVAKYAKDNRQLQETFKSVQISMEGGNNGNNDSSKQENKYLKVEAIQQISQLDGMVDQVDVIGIDEGQFYPDLVERVEAYLRKDKIIVISALDGTFERKPFGQIPELIPLCDDVIKLKAICMRCGDDAPFSHRLVQSKQIELVGWKDLYEPLCRHCYVKLNFSDDKI
ncbi:hypothetical protein FGO68_gene15707 [Halteria grandinella]|uniref:Thymidine kinase n=1 Tax=Halteria grandinella TaxID=5974 RepID=A0A8J8NJ82_HALGN|nr:hypothetical protein FGO68_gene15707 [Halteria grandinella]